MSTAEFIGLVAMMMALTALSIDIMLPALPAIGEALGVADANDRQIVIISYMLGFAVGQLVYGRLSDRYGRKPVLMAGMAIFIAGSLVAALAVDFTLLLAARTVQGIGAAAPRVIAFAIVRDRYSGREMARVMSFAMAVFIIIPVLAPAMGQGLLFVGTWRLMFDLVARCRDHRGAVGRSAAAGDDARTRRTQPLVVGACPPGGRWRRRRPSATR